MCFQRHTEIISDQPISLVEAMQPYIDGNGLIAPGPFPPGTMRSSDNGVMYSSEYLLILKAQSTIISGKALSLTDHAIRSCVGSDGELHRAPGDTTPDEVDDHYGVISAYTNIGWKVPFKLPIRLWRQPQLLYAYLLNKGVPSLLMPILSHFTAFILLTACLGVPASNSDARLLTWHLWMATRTKSFMCNLAGRFWYWRTQRVYKAQEAMMAVAKVYFSPDHPFTKYKWNS